MKFPHRKLATLVREAQARTPLKPEVAAMLARHRTDKHKMPAEERTREFQQVLRHDLAPLIRRLRPGSPPIQVIQMLNLDMDEAGCGPDIVQAGDLTRNDTQWKNLIGPAMAFYEALKKLGLKVTFEQVIGKQEPGQEMFDNFYTYLYVSLPNPPPASVTAKPAVPSTKRPASKTKHEATTAKRSRTNQPKRKKR